jgi:hypothetical protein
MQDRIAMHAGNPLRATDEVAFNKKLQAKKSLAPFKAHGFLFCDEGPIAEVAVEPLLTLLVFTELSY